MRTFLLLFVAMAAYGSDALQVKVDSGALEGALTPDGSVRAFKGVPFAAPPVGDLRWKAPQPAASWTGVRKANEFGARCVQASVYSDMIFRDGGMQEDCLFLNVWTPAKSAKHLPVLVYFHGGGFVGGSGDEPRYDGTNFAKHGVIVVTVNYRLGVFGFLAHPELTAESAQHASGNYGLLDQVASLAWVKRNIAAFGGDPAKVTIGGESAGSFAVSGLMASPLAQGLFRGAIGESGAMFTTGQGPLTAQPLAKAEQTGTAFETGAGAKSLADLRAKPANEILKAAGKAGQMRFIPIVDGYFMPSTPASIYAKGEQSRVPLLAGWNADEIRMTVLMPKERVNAKTFPAQLEARFHDQAAAAAKVYAASTDEEALQAAGDLASDTFIDYCTWKWIEVHAATSHAPVYRYEFDRPVPLPAGAPKVGVKGLAGHSWELEYVFGALDSKKAAWEPEDRQTAEAVAEYFANFVKTGNPNGDSLPKWPEFGKSHEVMHLDARSHAEPEMHRDRYEFLDGYYAGLAK